MGSDERDLVARNMGLTVSANADKLEHNKNIARRPHFQTPPIQFECRVF
jgi:hypothetical protein